MDFATDYLSTERPKIKLINQEGYTQEYKSFGGYLPSEEKIFVVVHNRNMADILRTLAHEMVHLYQMTWIQDPYANHNKNFFAWKNKFRIAGLGLSRC